MYVGEGASTQLELRYARGTMDGIIERRAVARDGKRPCHARIKKERMPGCEIIVRPRTRCARQRSALMRFRSIKVCVYVCVCVWGGRKVWLSDVVVYLVLFGCV